MDTVITAVTTYFSGTTGMLELIASFLVIINVYLLSKQKLINYWFGLAGVLIYGYIFYSVNLYSDAQLQWAFYAPLQIIGYVVWKYGHRGLMFWNSNRDEFVGHTDVLPVISMSFDARVIWVFGTLVVAVIWGEVMTNTDADFPRWDALTTVMSISASILMLKKYLENWMIWIGVDILSIFIYYAKGLYVTSGLYVIFLCLATYGLIQWKRQNIGVRHG